jgi:DNA topoisomerase IA
MFRNRTNAPGLEQELTEAIIKEIQASTDMRVVQATSAGSAADSVLTGTITKAELRALSLRDGTGLVQEVAVQLVVDFSWSRAGWAEAGWEGAAAERSRREKGTLVARQNFSAVDTFVPARPTGERLEVGETAAIARMAKAIVSEMRSAW